jgi:hypothetical protein
MRRRPLQVSSLAARKAARQVKRQSIRPMVEHRLYCDNKFTGVVVRQDGNYPSMWRIHVADGRVSDMVNLPRAKDAALTWAATGQRADRHKWKRTEKRAA